jgi:vancomycin resistance protein YoaR
MTTRYYPAPRRFHLGAQILAALLGGFLLFVLTAFAWTTAYQLFYAGRIFPGVNVAGVDLSGLSPSQAAVHLTQTLSYPYTGRILLRDGERFWLVTPAEVGMTFDASASAQAAYKIGRRGGPLASLAQQWEARQGKITVRPVIVFDQRVAHAYLQKLAAEINQPIIEANLELQGTEVVATPGQIGRALNVEASLAALTAQLQTFRDGEVILTVQEQAPELLDVSAQAETARQILSAPLVLSIPDATEGDPGPWTFDVQTLANMLTVRRVKLEQGTDIQVSLNPEALRQSLTGIAAQVNRPPENARFYFDDPTGQLVLIQSAKIGRTLDIDASIVEINRRILLGEHFIPLVIQIGEPQVKDTATAEELGIRELVGSYTSYYYGSSAERIQNIQAAAERFHGVLVAPGETFSMGQRLGDISLDNGFAEALIIYGGRTIKGVGGGVCQVSTTLFRAVFFAGYPINERHSHAYRVSYYEQTASGSKDDNLAGLDATVYFPLVDFKFTNDTPYWLLMETYTNVGARTLTWKLYSTSDGRTVSWETTGPVNRVPPPKALFEENPELGKNVIKQVDWAAEGADVTVTRTVYRNGAAYFTDIFKTHYEPWQAICQFGPGTEEPERLAKKKQLCQN